MNTSADAVRAAAHEWRQAGCSPLPIKMDGTKMPALITWAPYRDRKADDAELARWFLTGAGLGIVTGRGSATEAGALELLDFDSEETYLAYTAAAEGTGLADLVARIEGGYLERTPRPGYHWFYRCPTVEGNQKLAQRPDPEHPGTPKVLIETRGEGGQVVVAPSNGAVHETGRPYVRLAGEPATIATITPEERQQLLDLARSFDEVPPEPPRTAASAPRAPGGILPGEDYAGKTDAWALLQEYGWTLQYARPNGVLYLRHPGKAGRGHSATLNHVGSGLLFVFSTSTPFRTGRPYDAFGVYAVYEHGGDFSAAARSLRAQGYGSGPPVPQLNAAIEDFTVITPQAWAALSAGNTVGPRLFLHADGPTRFRQADVGPPRFQALGRDELRHEVARYARFTRTSLQLVRDAQGRPVLDAQGQRTFTQVTRVVYPPLPVIADMLATQGPPLPVVTRITGCPTFAPDGTLQAERGYHPAGRVYCAMPDWLEVPPVPSTPTGAEVAEALVWILDELLRDFPFAGDADRAHAVALGLLPFVRDMIAGPTPLHLFEAPSPGTGKGLAVQALLLAACGRGVRMTPQVQEEDEWRKLFTALLRDGVPAIVIDNVSRQLTSGVFASALTSETFSGRILGRTETIHLPVRCPWVVTGNNPILSDEIGRRSIPIRLVALIEDPTTRTDFRHKDLLTWAEGHRGRLIWAFLTLTRHWIAEGQQPFTERTLGSYEAWARVIGGILGAAGIEGFLVNIAAFRKTVDPTTSGIRALIARWWETHGGKIVQVADLIGFAREIDDIALGIGDEKSQRMRLGRLMGKQAGRVFGTHQVEVAASTHGARFRLRDLAAGATPFDAMLDGGGGETEAGDEVWR